MDQYAIYLRKSREDVEAEAQGKGETLKRHESLLLATAKKHNYNIGEIYREIVSGETISNRPEMIRLLQDVEKGRWKGVLVTEISRLARGNTADQGLIADTFARNGTLFITPNDVLNPCTDADEDRLDINLFISRFEYKTIKRRLDRGRTASLEAGKYIGSQAPYGYDRIKLKRQKGWSLEINEKEAPTVRDIFSQYLSGESIAGIARALNASAAATRHGGRWRSTTVRQILINPTYIGLIHWGENNPGKRSSKPPTVCQGLHEPLITEEDFNQVQKRLAQNTRNAKTNSLTNPLAGILRCGFCGGPMIRQPDSSGVREPQLMCRTPGCQNVSSTLPRVEAAVLQALADQLKQYKLNLENVKPVSRIETLQNNVEKIKKEIETLKAQQQKTYDLLEQGVYDTETFLDRNNKISASITEKEASQKSIEEQIKAENKRTDKQTLIPKIETILASYETMTSIKEKNALLKEVVTTIEYKKQKTHKSPTDFKITLHPTLP